MTFLVTAAVLVWWVFAGLPRSLEMALADAEWAPCIAGYDAAGSARDSARVDRRVLRPRSRFTPEVTCGSRRRARR